MLSIMSYKCLYIIHICLTVHVLYNIPLHCVCIHKYHLSALLFFKSDYLTKDLLIICV